MNSTIHEMESNGIGEKLIESSNENPGHSSFHHFERVFDLNGIIGIGRVMNIEMRVRFQL